MQEEKARLKAPIPVFKTDGLYMVRLEFLISAPHLHGAIGAEAKARDILDCAIASVDVDDGQIVEIREVTADDIEPRAFRLKRSEA